MKDKTKKKIGSSETTRKASVFNFDAVESFNDVQPLCNKDNTMFLEWFVGFTEGDGSFSLSKFPTLFNPSNLRPSFQINQKQPQVLYKIKKNLGFGIVKFVTEKRTGSSYYRFSVYKLKHVKQLILLFNGNLLLNKVQAQFAKWVIVYNDLCDQQQKNSYQNLIESTTPCTGLQHSCYLNTQSVNTKITVKPVTIQVDLHSAWLAGFTDAEGGFYASLSQNTRYSTGFRERLKYYIVQKGELEFLESLDQLIRIATLEKFSLQILPENLNWSNKKCITSIPNKQNIFRLEITRLESLEVIIDYFDRYPLLSKKQLVFVRWKRLVIYRSAIKAAALMSAKGMRRYKRLYASVGEIRKTTVSFLKMP